MSFQSSAVRATRRTKDAAEFDVKYGRSHYCYLQRAGAASYIKRQMRRRERREARIQIRQS